MHFQKVYFHIKFLTVNSQKAVVYSIKKPSSKFYKQNMLEIIALHPTPIKQLHFILFLQLCSYNLPSKVSADNKVHFNLLQY